MNKSDTTSGFTFVEVLVALAIFAVAGIALTAACANFLGAQQAAFRRDDQAGDRQLVRQALWAEPSRDKAEGWNDLVLPGNRTARWRAAITPAPVADLFDVSLEMELPAEDNRPVTQPMETTRLLRPTWSKGEERDARLAEARQKIARRNLP